MPDKKKFAVLSICILLGIVSFTYVFQRSSTLTITHDEAFSYNHVVKHPVMEIISYNTNPGPAIPNNHILNSLLMKYAEWMFGSTPFILRLPNVISYLFFLLFSFLICRKLKNPFWIISGFALLNSNPYLLEFFGLARGYGISNALLLGSIYFLLEWIEKKAKFQLICTFSLAVLAVLANFSLLNFFLSLVILVNGIFIMDQANSTETKMDRLKDLLKKNLIPFLFTISLGAILFEPLRKIMKWHQTFGGTTGFWHDTVIPEVSAYWYDQAHYPIGTTSTLALIIIFSVIIIASMTKSILKKEFRSMSFLTGALLFIPIVLYLLLHLLMGTEFLVARAAQYFTLLFLLASLFTLKEIRPQISKPIISLLALLSVIHLVQSANFRSTSEWRYDSENRSALEFINQQIVKNPKAPISIGVTWLLEPGFNYYIQSEKMNWLLPIPRESVLSRDFPIYYVTEMDTLALKQKGKSIIKRYQFSNSYIMK